MIFTQHIWKKIIGVFLFFTEISCNTIAMLTYTI